jgi:hypothetical protein
MKTIIIIIVISISFSTANSKDRFESSPGKARNKVTSFEKLDGSIINFDKNNKLSSVIETKKVAANRIQSKKRKNYIGKYYYHRANNITYVSNDLKDWKPLSEDNQIVSNSTVQRYAITPNPVRDYINLQGLDGENFEIYSIFGLKVMNGTCQWKIDVSILPSGIYLIRTADYFSIFIKI